MTFATRLATVLGPALGAVLALGASLAATPALAQCAYDQSSPAPNEVVKSAEPAVTIDFTDEFDLQDVRVVGAGNTVWTTDWKREPQDVRSASFRITQSLPPGKYLIEWNGYFRRHYHTDGGSIAFSVPAADGTIPPASPGVMPLAPSARPVGPGSPYRALLGAGAPKTDR